jgi:outer membrane protein OmpA-like peptidoglycan-associated protein
LVFEPIFAPRGAGQVIGGRLALSRLGKSGSAAKRGASVGAKLTFTAVTFESARGTEGPSREMGTLVGELSLSTRGDNPALVISRAASASLLAAPATRLDRKLRLELGKPSVSLASGDDQSSLRLVIPADMLEGARHLELRVKLELAGALEADEAVNDVLDVPLVPRPTVSVQLVDEVGKPLSGVPLQFGEGPEAELLTTDAEGLAQVDDLAVDGLAATITDDAGVRAELKSRWAKPQVGGILGASPETLVRFPSEFLDPIELTGVTRLRVSLQPKVLLARLLGLVFETNKSFLVPTAIPDLLELQTLSEENPDSEVLVVGHTDTSADDAVNDPLSLERAESLVAFLEQDVDTWLSRYEDKTPKARRWGSAEDLQMVTSLPNKPATADAEGGDAAETADTTDDDTAAAEVDESASDDPITRFQRSRGLKVDGKAGPETRRQLITEYMAPAEGVLPADMPRTSHGAGEHFPLDGLAREVDPVAADGQRDPVDRRVEIFFFEKEFGIQPAPPGKNSKKGSLEYPEWRRRSKLRQEADVRFSDRKLRLRLQVNDEDLADEEFALDVDGRRLQVARTDGEGFLEQRLPVGAELVEIRIPRLDYHRSISLVPSEEFPTVDTLRGVQTRLSQLGFLPKEVDGKADQLTRDALATFKKSRGLPEDGNLDKDTQDALKEAYGS